MWRRVFGRKVPYLFKVIHSFETSADTHPTSQRHIPDDSNLQQRRCKELRSRKYVLNLLKPNDIYRVSQEEWTKLRESVPYVKIYRYNPKHLYPKLNGYGDNGQGKVVGRAY